MTTHRHLPLLAALCALVLAPLVAPAPAQAQDKPEREPGVMHLGGVKIDTKRKFLEIKGLVSLDRGLIELLACSPKGKRYESALVLDCRADMLQTGLLMIGLKRGTSGRAVGERVKAKGSPVELLVTWTDPKTKKVKRYLAEDLVWNHRTRKSMQRVGWVFIGSRFLENPRTKREAFMASVTGTLIVTYHDPDAILDTPHRAGTDDTTFYANHLILPPRGTKLALRVYPKDVYAKLPAEQKAMALPNQAPEMGDAPGDEHRDPSKPDDDKQPDGDKPDKPEGDKPEGDKPEGDKPEGDKPEGDKPESDKPAGDKPAGDKPEGDKPEGDKPSEQPEGDKPEGDKPSEQPEGDEPAGDPESSDGPTEAPDWYPDER